MGACNCINDSALKQDMIIKSTKDFDLGKIKCKILSFQNLWEQKIASSN
jgi:hypothetical protein